MLERLHDFIERSFEPDRRFAGALDYQHQLDRWFSGRANSRTHRALRAIPAERLEAERPRMRPLPEAMPDLDRRFVTRVASQPCLRFDTNDYSLDPRLAGRRVEVRISQGEISATALDTGGFLEAVLSSEVASRESHGGQSPIKAARFPGRKTLEASRSSAVDAAFPHFSRPISAPT